MDIMRLSSVNSLAFDYSVFPRPKGAIIIFQISNLILVNMKLVDLKDDIQYEVTALNVGVSWI